MNLNLFLSSLKQIGIEATKLQLAQLHRYYELLVEYNKVMNLGRELAIKIAKNLELIGPLAIEFFLKDGELYFNEMAPRPHNSFHSTLDAFEESQFDLHIKSILGEKLVEPKFLKPVVMLNILGEDREKVVNETSDKLKKIYIYGKKEWKKARKMGHINFFGKDIGELINMAKKF